MSWAGPKRRRNSDHFGSSVGYLGYNTAKTGWLPEVGQMCVLVGKGSNSPFDHVGHRVMVIRRRGLGKVQVDCQCGMHFNVDKIWLGRIGEPE